jgi:site-specific recombinase XerD
MTDDVTTPINDDVSAATMRAYRADYRKFCEWCADVQLPSGPADYKTIVNWIGEMAGQYKFATVSRKIISVGQMHLRHGWPNPCDHSEVRAEIRRCRRRIGIAIVSPLPILWDDLVRMVAAQPSISFRGRRNRALLLVGWTTAMRRSELVDLQLRDIRIFDQGMIITIRVSKTDQFGKGQHVFVPRAPVEQPVCAVRELEEYLSRLPKGEETRPVFVRCGQSDLFYQPTKRPGISSQTVTDIVKEAAEMVDMDPIRYSAHSLRHGFATQCGALGIEERLIARQTRHKSMAVLRGYIAEGGITRDSPVSVIYRQLAASSVHPPREGAQDLPLPTQSADADEPHPSLARSRDL